MLIGGSSQEQNYSQLDNWMIFGLLLLFLLDGCTDASCTYEYFACIYIHDRQLPPTHGMHESYPYMGLLAVHTITMVSSPASAT